MCCVLCACMRASRTTAGAFECVARALLLEPTNTTAIGTLTTLLDGHQSSGHRTLSASENTLHKFRRRIEARTERGVHAQAEAYSHALALLESRADLHNIKACQVVAPAAAPAM